MVTAELRARIDRLWDAFWAAGISNSLEVVEQISHLVFVRYLEEFDSKRNDRVDREPVYTSETEHLRWSRVTNEDPDTMFALVRDALFPWLRDLRHEALTYSRYLESARFTIPTPGLLANVVDLVDEVPIGDPEVAGGMYEYVLDKVTTASRSPFTTPRHIVRLMVELAAPTPEDEICDPASGTAGFLVAAAEHIGGARSDARRFHGFEAAVKRLRLGSMNMLLHGHEDPDIRFRDSLAAGGGEGEAGRYSLILTRSPFGSTLEDDSVADDLRGIVETKKRELLFPALSSLLLEPGGRAAVIVPDGVLFGATKAHRELRRAL
ncbi:MAG: SAM-dependent DNA methyltransferase, partial [Saccharothrix sp.]|nr:SAM-dependent DNA methyltransferase [Saccharothrix sp.]